MKIKKLLAHAFVPMVVCAVILTTSHAQSGLPRDTKSGFVTTSDNVKIHYLEAGPRSRRRIPSRA